jgi:hypothetical protein
MAFVDRTNDEDYRRKRIERSARWSGYPWREIPHYRRYHQRILRESDFRKTHRIYMRHTMDTLAALEDALGGWEARASDLLNHLNHLRRIGIPPQLLVVEKLDYEDALEMCRYNRFCIYLLTEGDVNHHATR